MSGRPPNPPARHHTQRVPGTRPPTIGGKGEGAAPLVQIQALTVAFPDEAGECLVPVVKDVSLAIQRHEILGLVGESGSGKTQTALAVLGLTRAPGRVMGGRVVVDGEDVVGMDEAGLGRVRGRKVAMIFQSPRTSLNPLMTIGDQIGRVYQRHRGMGKSEAREASLTMLRRVGIAGPERVAASYPHQLSGGMAQRVMIGMMVACGPELLIADEPTTGLDVTIQAQIFDLIGEVQAETGMSVLLITHDLGVVAETCHRVAVMQSGRIVEVAPVDELFARPRHPYTVRLLGAMLHPDQPANLTMEAVPRAVEASIEVGDRQYRAVSVETWAEVGVSAPEMVEIEAEHWVLCHPVEVREAVGAGAAG